MQLKYSVEHKHVHSKPVQLNSEPLISSVYKPDVAKRTNGILYHSEQINSTCIKAFPADDPQKISVYCVVRSKCIKNEPFKIWSSNVHITPPEDLKSLFKHINEKIFNNNESVKYSMVDRSLSGHCHLTHTCANGNLKVLEQRHQVDDGALTCEVKQAFWDYYGLKNSDPEFSSVDAFFCTHGVATCELYLPFGKPLFISVTTRFEVGRYSPEQWKKWNQILVQIASTKRNVMTANNMFDLKYVQYFTGLSDDQITYFPSFCGYVSQFSYAPEKVQLLIMPRRLSRYDLKDEVINTLGSNRAIFMNDALGGHYEYMDIAKYKGVIFLPYQVSVMTLFEVYRMNVPIFAPSLNLLKKWHLEKQILNELTWNRVFGHPGPSAVLPHPKHADWPDPNDDQNPASLDFWLKWSDFYVFPHIVLFDDIKDIPKLMDTISFTSVSEKMKQFNEEQLKNLTDTFVNTFIPRMLGMSSCHPGVRNNKDNILRQSHVQQIQLEYPFITTEMLRC